MTDPSPAANQEVLEQRVLVEHSVSHDLRTPLRAIDGFSSLIEQRTWSEDPALLNHYLGRIRENIARMSRLIDDLLSFSRYGSRPLDMLDLDMNEVAEAAIDQVRLLRAAHGHADIAIGRLPHARGDRALILQVWINLIDNAIKYTSKVERPVITITGRTDAHRAIFEVADNGVGFDGRYSSKLFGVFERMHAASEYPGNGVGLAIVRRIVNRHGGEVWAHSELNKGATFGFSLPTVLPEPASRANAGAPVHSEVAVDDCIE